MSDLAIYSKVVFDPTDVVELRFIKKGERPIIRKDWKLAADLPGAMAELTSINNEGFDIYAGPNPRTAKGVSGDQARVLVTHIMHTEDTKKICDAPIPPGWCVMSIHLL